MATPTKSPPEDTSLSANIPGSNRAPKQGKMSASDRFIEYSTKIVEQVYTWRGPIVIGIAGVFAVAGAAAAYQRVQDNKNEEGAAEIYKATSALPGNEDALGQMGIDLDDIARSPEELKERNDKYLAAARQLEEIANRYSGVTSGRVAQLERAAFLAKAGQQDQATAAYKTVLDAGLEEPVFKFRALSGLANTYRDQKKYDEAAQQYERASNELDGLWKQQALIELARTYELKNDYGKAAATYERFMKDFPQAPQLADIEARLAVAKAGGPPAAPASPGVPGEEAAAVDPNATGAAPVPGDGVAPAAPAPDVAAPAAPAGESGTSPDKGGQE